MKKYKINHFISPWALPHENIPLELKWEKDIDFDVIEVKLSENIDYVGSINLNNEIKINKSDILIPRDAITYPKNTIGFPNFFGLIVKYTNLEIPNFKTKCPIVIEFYKNKSKITEVNFEARIFRPFIRILEVPSKLVLLRQRKRKYLLNISLEFIGFGFISMKTSLNIRGVNFKAINTISEKVKQNIIKLEETDPDTYNTFKLTPQIIEDFFEKIRYYEENDKFDKKNLLDALENGELNPILFLLYIYEFLKIFEKAYISKNIELKEPFVLLKKKDIMPKITELELIFDYNDNIKNFYNPVKIIIPVLDKREPERIEDIELEIRIKKVEYHNFENIELEEIP